MKILNKNIKKLEAELPFGLKRMSILLNSGVDFYKTLRIISKEEGEFSKFTGKIVSNLDNGLSLNESFRTVSREYPSPEVKRVVSQVIAVYKSGEKGEQIRRIGEEMLSKQEYKTREYSSKSAVYGLLFVVLSVMVPTLLTILYFVGSFAMGWDMSIEELGVILLVAIPIVNLIILYVSRMQGPEIIYKEKENVHLIFAGVMIVLSLIAIKFGIIAIVLMIVCGAVFIYKKYGEEKRKEELEENLPDMLLHIAGLEGMSLGRILREISNSNYKALSEEFTKSYNQFKSNVSSNKIINDLMERNKSVLFSKTMFLFNYVLESSNFKVFAEMAEDILKYFEIKRERANAMAMQKYTLILGAILIPVIMSVAGGMAETLGSIAEMNKDASVIFETFVPAYLVIYSLLAGYHIMESEDKKSNGMIYTVFMLAAGLTLYFLMMNA